MKPIWFYSFIAIKNISDMLCFPCPNYFSTLLRQFMFSYFWKILIKSFSNQKVIPMSLSVVTHAARQGSQSVTEIATTVPDARCSLWYALNAVRILKCRLSLVVTGRFTAAIATVKSEPIHNSIVITV